MKTKTIKKILSTKMEEWLESITDPKVRTLARRDSMVTGGCIASMLLREDVNDFDVYFLTKETTLAVSHYYAKEFKNVIVVDGEDAFPEDVVLGLDKLKFGMWPNQRVLFYQTITPERVKLFIPDTGFIRVEEQRAKEKKFVDQIVNLGKPRHKKIEEEIEELPYQPAFFSENAISLTNKVQLIVRFHGTVEEIHSNYDYVHATNYYMVETGKLVLRQEALEVLLTKELRYIGSKYPLTSVIRSKKFLNRGYTISAGEYFKMLWQVADLDLRNPAVLMDQLVGVDIAYFSTLLGILQGTPPEKLSYPYIAKVVDKVFGEEDTILDSDK